MRKDHRWERFLNFREHQTASYPVLFSLLAECDDSNCNSQIELIAIRDFGTSKEMMRKEIPTWNLGSLVCEQGHQVIRPGPEKLS